MVSTRSAKWGGEPDPPAMLAAEPPVPIVTRCPRHLPLHWLFLMYQISTPSSRVAAAAPVPVPANCATSAIRNSLVRRWIA